jgi:putative multiple sugar transport system ATP-binding protein
LKNIDYILEMDNIGKEFPGVKALADVNFKVKRGEIHCLVGENGAGKSTLMKVLSGVYPAGTFSGRIILNSSEQHFKNISDSETAGIAIIYQELALIPELTIHENIFFGHELKKGQFIDWNETVVQAKEMLEKIHVNINPETKVKNVGVGVQQLVEIGKALSKNVKLLILDEPTAALSEVDCDNLLQILRDLKEQGVTCIMISHKLREVISIADTITVLRDGKTIVSIDATERKVEESEIIKHMVGREIEDVYPKRKDTKFGDVCFQLKNWTAFDPIKGREILHNIDFNIRQGEIVGIAGLMGAGRTEMALSIFGNTKHYDIKGELYVKGVKKNLNSCEKAIKEKIAYVTEDRKGNGLVLIQDIKFNTTLANLKQLLRGFFIDENEEVNVADKFFKQVRMKAQSIEQVVGTLSGGNQQKVSLAKWLFAAPNLLILDEPTRGIDVGAKFEICTIMNELVKKGMSIIMISSELPEILGMSDRIYVMSDGAMNGVIDAKDATEEKIMEMATA